MKNIKDIAVLFIVLFFGIMPSFSVNAAFAADSSHKAVFLFTTTQEEKEVTIVVKLEQNDGVSTLNMELTYDLNAMTLTNVEKGANFDSIVYTNQPGGFAVTPFKFNWMDLSKINDTSTGTFLTLTFGISDNAANGTYTIGFKNVEAFYYEQDNPEPVPVTTIVDTTKVVINDGNIDAKTVPNNSEATESKGPNVGLIVGLSCGGAVIVGGAAVFIVRKLKRTKKGWRKLNDKKKR